MLQNDRNLSSAEEIKHLDVFCLQKKTLSDINIYSMIV